MSNSQFTPDQDEGKEAWKSLRGQLFELRGFTLAMFRSLFQFIKSSILFIVFIPALFWGATYTWYQMQEPSYQVSMTVSYVHLEKKIYGDMIVKLNNSIRSEGVGNMPGFDVLPPEIINSLLEVKAINLKGEELSTDLTEERIPFDLVVEVSQLEGLPELGLALVDYLDSPDFVQERLAFNMNNAKEQIAYYSEQLETMKTKLDETDAANSPGVLESLVNQMNESRSKLAESQGQLKFNTNIEVLHGFQASSAQKNESGKKRAQMAGMLGLLLAFIIAVYRK